MAMSATGEARAAETSSHLRADSDAVIFGRFEYPREEQRIVTFIDLVGSTGIAERLGSVRFYALLSDIFTRLSEVITGFGGEVHRYVGDTLIATWPLGSCRENARSISALFACRDALELAGSEFLQRHGHIPEFRASLHCGPLVAAAIDAFKGEVVLVGDAMNTAARIEQACRATGHRMLVSRSLLMRALLPDDVLATSIGPRPLRGKAERLELFSLERYAAGEEAPGHFLQACA
jgi:adenylate cyclase